MTITSTLTVTQRLPADPSAEPSAELSANICLTLALTAEDRTRSRHFFETGEGQGVYLQLPRGTVLRDGDLLRSPDSPRLVRVIAKPEPVLTVTGHTPLELLRAAYHLGNRHVPLEVTETYLRLSPDSVLAAMLLQMGLHVYAEVAPFQPETGAYGHDSGGHKAEGHNHHH